MDVRSGGNHEMFGELGPAPSPSEDLPDLLLSSPFRWGRWREILTHGRFKRRLSERDVETICRTILVYCLLHYRGDENIKSFIWDLISPTENGKTKELQNHSGEVLPGGLTGGGWVVEPDAGTSLGRSLPLTLVFSVPPQGLSIPVPRGRKGKKVKAQNSFDLQKAEWIRRYDPDALFQDESYKKHLKHQCNKWVGVPWAATGGGSSPTPPSPALPSSGGRFFSSPVAQPLPVPRQGPAEGADALLPAAGGHRGTGGEGPGGGGGQVRRRDLPGGSPELP